jgi:hypothetical protein
LEQDEIEAAVAVAHGRRAIVGAHVGPRSRSFGWTAAWT